MGWFEEQINYRREKDNEAFSDALDAVAGAVMGKRLTQALDSREAVSGALDEILKFYHCKIKTDEETPSLLKTPEEQLDHKLRPYGIMHRAVKLDKGWQNNAAGAMLGTLRETGTAVALLPGKVSGYTYLDFATGKKVRVTRKTAPLLDDEAVCFYKPLPMRRLTVRDLLLFMAEQLSISDIVLYIGMTGVVTLFGLLGPLVTNWLYGYVLPSGSLTVLLALAVFMIGRTLCSLCIGAFQSLHRSRIGIKQDIAVQAAVMSRILSLPTDFFKQYSSGELSKRSSYVQSLCSMLMNTVAGTTLTSLFSLVYLGSVFAYAPVLVLPSLLFTLASLTLSIASTFARMRISRESMQTAAKTSGVTYSTITGIQKIKLAGAEKRMFARWAREYAKSAQLAYNPPSFVKLSGTFSLTLTLVSTLVMYYLAVRSGVSVADYCAFTAAYGMVSATFTSFAGIVQTLSTIRPTLEMARPILETEPETGENREIVSQLSGSIEISHVSFRYGEKLPLIVDDLSLKIRRGEFVAIVGPTGCGKSTLVRLLLGFETPEKGAIYYDQKDMSQLDLKSLRRRIGTVMQDGKLFTGDIYSNIVISAPQLSQAEAWEAAEMAAVADDIRAMPMGMFTMISEGQGGISGGQKQRLLIARALAPKPGVLLFDEATSALDNITQKQVSDAIDTLKCTRIVIAHRLSTIRNADRILYLENGRIQEEGTYEELTRLNGKFAELVRRQLLDSDC